ncbi:MAG: S1C family serine protease [Candidatus Brocadiales bacterium]
MPARLARLIKNNMDAFIKEFSIILFIFCTNIVSLLFLPSVSQAYLFSGERTPEEIAKKHGWAVVSVTSYDKDDNPLVVGSGFIVARRGMLNVNQYYDVKKVVTNYHCIKGATTARIRLTNGDYYDVVGVLGVDQDWDIAVLKIMARRVPGAPLGNSDKLSVGERVVAIGNPQGLENTVSEGVISAIRGREGTGGTIIQFTAPISQDSSGGPLFNTKGKVVGVTTLYLKEGQNLNLAVPINRVKPLLKGIKSVALTEVAKER